LEVLKTNNLLSSEKYHPGANTFETVDQSEGDYQQDSSAQSDPFKILVTGKTVTALLYSSCDVTSTVDPYNPDGYDVRIPASMSFQASFYNPMLCLQSSRGEVMEKEEIVKKTIGDISVFDIAVTCNKELNGLGK